MFFIIILKEKIMNLYVCMSILAITMAINNCAVGMSLDHVKSLKEIVAKDIYSRGLSNQINIPELKEYVQIIRELYVINDLLIRGASVELRNFLEMLTTDLVSSEKLLERFDIRALYGDFSNKCCQYFPRRLLEAKAIFYHMLNEQRHNTSKLIRAIILNDKKAIELLLEDKPNLDGSSEYFFRTTPLIEAVRFGQKKLVETMLNLGANINVRDANGATPLIIAATYGSTDVVELLLSYHAKVNISNDLGYAGLLGAIAYGNKDLVNLLISNGARVEAKNQSGVSALMIASKYGYKEIAQILFDKKVNSNDQTKGGDCAISMAIQNRNKEMVSFLIDHEADLCIVDGLGNTLLHDAAKCGKTEIAQLLIDKGKININETNMSEFTPLMVAVKYGHKEMAKLLLENCANPNCKTKDDDTPLTIAASRNDKGTIVLLISYGALVTPDFKAPSALFIWLRERDPKSTCKKTALLIAIDKCYIDIAEILFKQWCTEERQKQSK